MLLQGCIYPHGTDYSLYSDAPSIVEEKPWLGAKPVSFQRYFDKIYKEISTLKFVPVPAAGNFGPAICAPKDSEAAVSKLADLFFVAVLKVSRSTVFYLVCMFYADLLQAIKNLYREYGWPDAFRKEEFLRVAATARTAILDDLHAWSDA